jgi:hypothetical protein
LLSYSFIIIFIFLSIYLANSFKNYKLYRPLLERLQEEPTWRNDLLKAGKITINDKEFNFGIFSKKIFHDNVEHIVICIQSKSKDFFEIRQTNLLEKLFIKLLLLEPVQTLKKLYGNSIYIASDNIDFYDILSNENSVTKIKHFLQKQPIIKNSSLKLYNSDNEFCMKFSLNKNIKLKDINIDEIFSVYGDEFLSIFYQLKLNEENEVNHYENIRSKTKNLRFIILLALIGSFFSFIYNSHKVFPQVIDMASLVFLSMLLSTLISIFVMIFIFKKLKHSSFFLDIEIKYTVASLLSTLTISYFLISYVNAIFDTSKPEILTRTVIDKRKASKTTSYYVQFEYKYSQTITGDELRVPYEIYKNKKNINIYIKSGYFNIKYIDDIK